jgi:hypothetical protein
MPLLGEVQVQVLPFPDCGGLTKAEIASQVSVSKQRFIEFWLGKVSILYGEAATFGSSVTTALSDNR